MHTLIPAEASQMRKVPYLSRTANWRGKVEVEAFRKTAGGKYKSLRVVKYPEKIRERIKGFTSKRHET